LDEDAVMASAPTFSLRFHFDFILAPLSVKEGVAMTCHHDRSVSGKQRRSYVEEIAVRCSHSRWHMALRCLLGYLDKAEPGPWPGGRRHAADGRGHTRRPSEPERR